MPGAVYLYAIKIDDMQWDKKEYSWLDGRNTLFLYYSIGILIIWIHCIQYDLKIIKTPSPAEGASFDDSLDV